MVPICCPETSVTTYNYSLRNNSEELDLTPETLRFIDIYPVGNLGSGINPYQVVHTDQTT